MSKATLREKVIGYVQTAYREGRGVPSLAEMKREFGVSNRELYKVFPGGLREICELAGVPPPEDRLKPVEKMLEHRVKTGSGTEGMNEVAAKVFELLGVGTPLTKIVVQLRIDPDLVVSINEKYTQLKKAEANKTIVQSEAELLKQTLGSVLLNMANLDLVSCPKCYNAQMELVDDIFTCPECGFKESFTDFVDVEHFRERWR